MTPRPPDTQACTGRRVRAAAASAAGFVLPTAVLVLTVVTLLAAAAVTVAITTSSSNTRDEHSKAALEAAEAGLRVASYRLNVLNPTIGDCINESEVAEPNVALTGYCSEAKAEPIGNNAEFRYWTTPGLRAGMSCVGQTVSTSEETREKEEAVEQRCVTAEGTVRGVHARVQARVATFIAAPLFPFPGITGTKLVKISGKTILNTAVASNYKIVSEGTSAVQYSGYCELAYTGTFEGSNEGERPCKTLKQRGEAEGQFQLRPVEPGTSSRESASAETCSIAKPPTENCDVRITNGLERAVDLEKKVAYKGGLYDQITLKPGSLTFTPSISATEPRYFSLKGGSSWTIGAGVYNFCNFKAEGGTLTLAAGAEAEIFIEAPESEEPGSGCPAGSGKLEFKGGTVINNLSENPTALKFFVWGKGPVLYEGKSNTTVKLSMTLIAPEAKITVSGTGTYTGGISGSEVFTSGEFAFEWRKEEEALRLKEEPKTASYYRTAWTQCTPTASSSEPMSGC